MQVQELQSIEALHSFRLLSGDSGLSNLMKDVVLLEYESLKQKTPLYYQEDFIVTTLFYAKDNSDLLFPTVERLIDLGAAGLAFKSVYYTALPEAVLALSRQRNFPIFIFDDLYMEDVILSISDYIRQRQEFSLFEEPLCNILMEQSTPDIQQYCNRMNPGRQKYMCAVYIHPAQPESNWSGTLRDTLRMRSSRELTGGYRFLQFRRGFFVLWNDTQEPKPEDVANQCRDLLCRLGCLDDDLCLGVSNIHQRTEDFDCVIREAFDALTVALATSQVQVSYSELGYYPLIFPMLRDKSARWNTRQLINRLSEYDQNSGSSNLTTTLKTYAAQDYDIRRTAEAMHQHPNTIRYRLKKIGELIGTSNHIDEAMFLLGEFLRLDALRQMIF